MNRTSGFINSTLLIVTIVLGVVCFSGWLVFNHQDKQQSTTRTCMYHPTITDGGQSQDDPLCIKPTNSFDECQDQPGSKIQESYPEVCVDVYGSQFINTAQEKNTRPPR